MSVEIVKMSGDELKKVWKRSGLSDEDIRPRLGISRSTFYNIIKEAEIPDEVEVRVDTDPELSKWKNAELARPKNDQVAVSEAMRVYGELAGSIKATLEVVTQMLLKQESKYDNLARNNEAILKNNSTVLEFLDIAKKEGEFHYTKKAG